MLAASVVASVVACSGASSSELPPTTGIILPAETLTAGYGCGTKPTQLFRYAVVVFRYGQEDGGEAAGDPSEPSSYRRALTSNVFDCFSDATFSSLVGSTYSGVRLDLFRLEVFAFNADAYAAARGIIDVASTNPREASLEQLVSELRGTSPTWTTECTATQLQHVQSLATCAPLSPGLTGVGGTIGPTKISLGTASFRLADGRTATCATEPDADAGAGGDAGDSGALLEPDAGEAAPDAGDADAAVEAGQPITFHTVRVRARVGASIVGTPVDIPCPTPFVLEVPPGSVQYHLDVGLLDSAENLVDPSAVTTCSVTSQPGVTSSAVCP